jgi:hypothetical protein
MSDSKTLRDNLLKRLNSIVADGQEELSPSMVSACVNFLKTFPPEADLDMIHTGPLHDSLQKYAGNMPFRS